MLNSGCLFWLQRLQPVFLTIAVVSVTYQVWLVLRRPPPMRTRAMKAIMAASLSLNTIVIGGWAALAIRYR